jgi:hypothetical protein
MVVFEAIVEARAGARCGFSSLPSPDVTELAREFGLFDGDACYKEIDEESARRLVEAVLRRDLAYNSELMPQAQARQLASQFLAYFDPGARYYTNGTWHEVDNYFNGGSVSGISWDPAAQATFDTGVLVIGRDRSGCLWVEDED